MSFFPILQSAPRRHGIVATPVHSPWTGTSEPYYGVWYLGDVPASLVLTALGTGTVGAGTLVVSYTDGLGNTGSFSIGSDYTADDPIQLADGTVTVHFPAGTTVVTNVSTVALTPSNEIIPGHQKVVGEMTPTAVEFERTIPMDRDDVFTSWDYRVKKAARAILRAPAVRLDHVEEAGRLAVQRMKHNRHLVTLGENYDETTQLLWRGSNGAMPIVGPYPVYTHDVSKVYFDPDVQLLRTVAASTVGPGGAPLNVSASPAVDRMLQLHHPDADENLIQQSHPVTGASGWQIQTGTPTISIVRDVPDVIDLDDAGFPAGFSIGVVRCDMDATEAVECPNTTVSSGIYYASGVWLRGRGSVDVEFNAGGTKDTAVVTLTSSWQWVTVSGLTSATTFNLEIVANDNSVVYISMVGLNAGRAAAQPMPTNGGAINGAGDAFHFPIVPSLEAGSISLWVLDLMDPATGSQRAICDGGTGDFAILYDYANNELDLRHLAAGTLLSGSADITDGEIHQIAATWEKGAGNTISRSLYFDGAVIAGPTTTSSWDYAWADKLRLLGDLGADIDSMMFAEVRVDRQAWTAAEVLSQYERFTQSHWIELHRELAGRQFWFQSLQETRRSKSNPGQWLIDAQLLEGNSEDSGLVLMR